MSASWLYLGNRILCSPLEALFTLLIFILSNELNATPLQLTLIAITKPLVSLFAFCVNSLIKGKIRNYLIMLNVLGCLPCLLFPFMLNVWFFIAAHFCFMLALRSSYPAWTELLKRSLNLKEMSGVISKGTSVNYCITIFFPLFLSFWMDQNHEIWKLLFFAMGLIQLFSTLFLWQMKPCTMNSVALPWKAAWKLCKEELAFTKYLALFFLGGAGLVALQPVLPLFFKEHLHLSYQQLTIAIGLCKGGAFVLASPLWAHWVNRISLYSLNFYINIFSCLFILFLDVHWIFAAYLMYGIMQAGCELSLHLSPPIFAKKKESTLYSGVNLALIGIRGCIFPVLGQLLYLYSGAYTVLFAAGGLCLIGILYAKYLDREYVVEARV